MGYQESGIFMGTISTKIRNLAREQMKLPFWKAGNFSIGATTALLENLEGTVFLERSYLPNGAVATYLTGDGVRYLLNPGQNIRDVLLKEIGECYFPLIQAALKQLVESQK